MASQNIPLRPEALVVGDDHLLDVISRSDHIDPMPALLEVKEAELPI